MNTRKLENKRVEVSDVEFGSEADKLQVAGERYIEAIEKITGL